MHLLLVLSLFAQPAQTASPDAAHLKLTAPAQVTELDTGKLGGDITQVAWSPDGTQLYVRATKSDRFGNEMSRHYLLALDGSKPKRLDVEPDWASAYWSWKSSPSSPGSPAFRIQIDQQAQTLQGSAAPMGGALATGGTEASAVRAWDRPSETSHRPRGAGKGQPRSGCTSATRRSASGRTSPCSPVPPSAGHPRASASSRSPIRTMTAGSSSSTQRVTSRSVTARRMSSSRPGRTTATS